MASLSILVLALPQSGQSEAEDCAYYVSETGYVLISTANLQVWFVHICLNNGSLVGGQAVNTSTHRAGRLVEVGRVCLIKIRDKVVHDGIVYHLHARAA